VSWLEEITISSASGTPSAGVDLSVSLQGAHESEDQRDQSSRLVIVSHATEVARLSKEAARSQAMTAGYTERRRSHEPRLDIGRTFHRRNDHESHIDGRQIW
jgi:hypothetical protein